MRLIKFDSLTFALMLDLVLALSLLILMIREYGILQEANA
jgi:hypothetical protein